ncbi:MAG TPA: RsmE family RNA methyltransferase [Persephonella sp.]|uniref:Ribosomal RNA small subunit methyltransferase E n=1 Tax=Persephonella marina (strain DSM 14350 / EX-H1) TaxID=123214 RepID=C0QU86_PERMH|nr:MULTISPECIES: RsmE family RNA methyltransferase [Persephonella]ACO04927.1 ribosomal RNA small subunit methyltransferase E (16S rRNAm3U1498 methyltransferase) [Persephonella marina EX-H1]HCB70134.1 RsmE family RNA methyltransferase [Persephonella sp.]
MGYERFIGQVEDGYAYLTEDELKHAKVKRVKTGDRIEINDLKGNVYLTEVLEITKRYIKCRIIEKIKVEEEDFRITLYQCMPNQLSKIDDIIEGVSQLGVYRFVPVISERSAVKTKDVLKKIKKWEKKALNSIKQCKRLYPVIIENPVKLEDIKSDDEGKFVFYEKEEKRTVKEFLDKKLKNVSVVIGPEGGFTEGEIKILQDKGFIPLTMGKNILRMETAVITGICQIRFLFD